jgi:hypothetical protein
VFGGGGGDNATAIEVLADAGRTTRSDTAMKACEHDLDRREAQRISSTTLWGTPCPTSRRSPPNRMPSHLERAGEGAQNRQAMLVKRTAWMRKGSGMKMLGVAMVQSNDPAEVPISIHDGGSRMNVKVPNRRTSARDACTCQQAVE